MCAFDFDIEVILFLLVLVCIIALCLKILFKVGREQERGGEPVTGGRRYKPEREEKQDKPLDLGSTETIAAATMKSAIDAVSELVDFGPLTGDTQKKLEKKAKDLKVDVGLLIKLHRVITKEKIITSVEGAKAKSDEIVAAAKSSSILEVAKKMKLPPLVVARQVLLAKGHELPATTAILKGEQPVDDDLQAQINEAAAHDFGGDNNMQAIVAAENKVKDAVAKELKKKNISFKNADQLREDQVKEHGKPIATPDFFFAGPVEVAGRDINWLKVVDFPLTSASARTVARAAYKAINYNKIFGQGAVLFSHLEEGAKLATKKGDVDCLLLARN